VKNINLSKLIQDFALVIAFVVVLVFFIWGTGGGILLPMNINSIIAQNAYVFILATGMLLCILTGGNIDLSVGSTMALVAAIGATLITNQDVPVLLAMVIMMLSGIVIGVWQGFWIAYVRIPPFIVTLAGMLTFRGLTNIVLRGLSVPLPDSYTVLFNSWIPDVFNGTDHNITAIVIGALVVAIALISSVIGRLKRSKKGYEVSNLIGFVTKLVVISFVVMFVTFRLSQFRGIPVVLLWIGVVVLVYWYITSKTTVGRHFYAVGGNEKAAKLSGINTNRVYFIAYVNMSFLAAVAGMVFSSRLSAAIPTLGLGFELDAIASCFIGGASAYGGIGTVPRVILGATLMGIINLGMFSMGFDQNLQNVIRGLVLLGAVIFDVVSKKLVRA
jgi:putative multiple sugar transport system permease protein